MAKALICRSPRRNSTFTGKDRLPGATPGLSPTDGSNTSTLTSAISHVPTFALPVATIAASSPVSAFAIAPTIALSFENELFKQFMKAYLETQVPGQITLEIDPEPRKQPLKAWFLDLYYGNLHMDYY